MMLGEGYQVDAGDLRAQAGRDRSDADELDGVARGVFGVGRPAAAGGADSTDLQGAMEYAVALFRDVFSEFSDAASILGFKETSAASGYEANESFSAGIYGRMEAV